MKWLLITTRHTNPGDEFARMGVQRAISVADPNANFILLNKESPEIHQPVEFDRAVICGMPLFWSLPWKESWDCRNIEWWAPIIRGWISKEPGKLAAIGVGDVMTPHWTPERPDELQEAVDEVVSRTAFVTLRAIIPELTRSPEVSCCPSAFEFFRNPPTPNGPRLCNFMVNGGHFHHPHADFLAWKEAERPLAQHLRERGFIFVAHNVAEFELAQSLGWSKSSVFYPATADDVASIYKVASVYIGNRVHGGAVCAARKVPSLVVTYDSRLRMAWRLGADVCRPSPKVLESVKSWSNLCPPPFARCDIEAELTRTVEKLTEFME